MKDLIRDLRTRADELEHDDRGHATIKLLRRAANELERLQEELDHSEWLRNRGGQVYARVGDQVI